MAAQDERSGGPAPTDDPPTQQLSSGDPLATQRAPAAPAEGAGPQEAAPEGAEQPTVAAEAVPEQAAAPSTDAAVADSPEVEQASADARPRFRRRTRMRRRLRYLRRLRELAFRDLGGLVFDLHRFGRDRGDLVSAKLQALVEIDRELRTLEGALRDRRELIDLREAGIAACPRCGTLHDTDANFCPGCGTSLRTAIVRDAAPVTVTPVDEQQQPGATGS